MEELRAGAMKKVKSWVSSLEQSREGKPRLWGMTGLRVIPAGLPHS